MKTARERLEEHIKNSALRHEAIVRGRVRTRPLENPTDPDEWRALLWAALVLVIGLSAVIAVATILSGCTSTQWSKEWFDTSVYVPDRDDAVLANVEKEGPADFGRAQNDFDQYIHDAGNRCAGGDQQACNGMEVALHNHDLYMNQAHYRTCGVVGPYYRCWH